MSGRRRKISMPTRVQEVIIQEGEWPDTSSVYGLYTYQPTIDTFDTVYSSFHLICIWPAKTFGGHYIGQAFKLPPSNIQSNWAHSPVSLSLWLHLSPPPPPAYSYIH
jgi:hypothetical protein